MLYTTRTGDRPGHAHVNYACPCGCEAGLPYDRESGAEHLGACCCGRLLWVGADAEARLRRLFEPGAEYFIDFGAVTLPWGDEVPVALAVPASWVRAAGPDSAARVRDVVCGMTIDPARATGSSVYGQVVYYFCAPVCKQRFDVDPARFLNR